MFYSIAISTATVTAALATTSGVTVTTASNAAFDATSTTDVPNMFTSSPTLSASQSDDNSSSVGVIVAIVVLVVVVFIIITVVVVGIIVVWKRKKSEQHTKQEGIYYSTIDEATLRSPTNKQITKMNTDEQGSREPQYMEISKSTQPTKQIEKVAMQDNPAYTEHEHSVKMKMFEGAYSPKQSDKLTIQDNPSYSILCGHQIKMEDNPAYSVSFDTKQ